MVEKKWLLKNKTLVQNLNQLQQVLLTHRQWQISDLQAPLDLKQLSCADFKISTAEIKKAYQRLQQAQAQKEEVVIFGDYDVDGNCATAIMWQALKELDLQARPFIPHRSRHGYGMSIVALQEICQVKKPDLIITVDNGITAHEALAYCQEHKIDIIITDHHLPSHKKSPALATIQTDLLSGAGVAWFASWQWWRLFGLSQADEKALALLDLVALATIADQVPLTGLNRALTKAGLKQLRQTKRAGLIALLEKIKTPPPQLQARDLDFGLAPRINAIGRLANTLDALRLLCTNNLNYARRLAQVLEDTNLERQELTANMLNLALKQVEKTTLPPIITVASPDFHEGIIGLIASRLVELYHRPALAVCFHDDLAKGSARSLKQINITQFLRQFEADFISLGGHTLAGGFAVEKSKWPSLQKKIHATALQQISAQQLQPQIEIETAISAKVLADPELINLLDELEPFGVANPEPIILLQGEVGACYFMGAENQHLKIIIKNNDLSTAILFWHYQKNNIPLPQPAQTIKAIGTMKVNQYQGRTQIDLWGQAWHPA